MSVYSSKRSTLLYPWINNLKEFMIVHLSLFRYIYEFHHPLILLKIKLKDPFVESTYLAIHQNVIFERNETSASGHTGCKNVSIAGLCRKVLFNLNTDTIPQKHN